MTQMPHDRIPMPVDMARYQRLTLDEQLKELRNRIESSKCGYSAFLQTPNVDVGLTTQGKVIHYAKGPVTIITFTIVNEYCCDDPSKNLWVLIDNETFERRPISQFDDPNASVFPGVRTSIVPDPPAQPLPPPPPVTQPRDIS